jgi:hypothetical protein
MRDGKITVTKINNIIITMARTAPLESKIIVKQTTPDKPIETLSVVKQKQYGLLDQPTVLPIDPQDPFSF